MEYKPQLTSPPNSQLQPRLIIHGGAGNITPATLTPERYAEFRTALLTIVRSPFPSLQPIQYPFPHTQLISNPQSLT
jgi:hypothetical protein